MTERYDLLVLGSGSAAREAASRAALDHGASVAVVERERWGGQCPNVACKPTKQYVTAAEILHDLRGAADLGIEVGAASFDLARLRARKDWLVGTPEAWRQRFVDAGYETIDGEARFVDPHSVRVGDRLLGGDRILVATGSRTAVPPIEGIDGVPWLDHVGALELDSLPESLLVLGAGAVGLELAQAFARFGTRVTLVEGARRIAGRSDPDAAAEVALALADDGIDIVVDTFVTSVAAHANGLEASLTPRNGARPRSLVAAMLLVASGRRPNVEALDLERAGVQATGAGILVDASLRTNVPGIWAAGDVTATVQLTPVATLQAQVAVADMFGGTRTLDYAVVPTAIFTDPELASVGLTEDDAHDQGLDAASVSYGAAELLRPYYTVTRDATPRGLVKLVYDRGSRRLLGVHVAARGASELVQGYALALRLRATIDDVALAHYAFPTIGEGVHYAAEAALSTVPTR